MLQTRRQCHGSRIMRVSAATLLPAYPSSEASRARVRCPQWRRRAAPRTSTALQCHTPTAAWPASVAARLKPVCGRATFSTRSARSAWRRSLTKQTDTKARGLRDTAERRRAPGARIKSWTRPTQRAAGTSGMIHSGNSERAGPN